MKTIKEQIEELPDGIVKDDEVQAVTMEVEDYAALDAIYSSDNGKKLTNVLIENAVLALNQLLAAHRKGDTTLLHVYAARYDASYSLLEQLTTAKVLKRQAIKDLERLVVEKHALLEE